MLSQVKLVTTLLSPMSRSVSADVCPGGRLSGATRSAASDYRPPGRAKSPIRGQQACNDGD